MGRRRRGGHAAAATAVKRRSGAEHGAVAVGVVTPVAQDRKPSARGSRGGARFPLVAEHDYLLWGIVKGDAALARGAEWSWGIRRRWLADLREDRG